MKTSEERSSLVLIFQVKECLLNWRTESNAKDKEITRF